MRLDLAAGNGAFQAAKGTGDNRVVVAEISGPLVGPEVPSEAECKKLLSNVGGRSAWCLQEDDDPVAIRMKFSGFQAVWVGKILHEGEKLRGALKSGKATEDEVRTAWYSFALGDSAPGSGRAQQTVIEFAELLPYFDGDEEKAEALAQKMEAKGAKIIR